MASHLKPEHGGLDGRVAVVTGASRGIGRATAFRLAAAGATVVLTADRAPDILQDVAEDITRHYGVETLAIPSDAADSAAISALYATVFKTFKRLDILVNNAGILDDARLGMIADSALDRLMKVNLTGAILNLQTAARLMRRTGGGAIVNTSSIIGLRGNPGQVAYGASKAGLVGVTLSAAKELGPDGIRVNAVAPGYIETDMITHLSDEVHAERLRSIPLGRIGHPDDVAKVTAFLVSDDAAYVTGQVIGVDGGMVI